jgi:hypothetical protein
MCFELFALWFSYDFPLAALNDPVVLKVNEKSPRPNVPFFISLAKKRKPQRINKADRRKDHTKEFYNRTCLYISSTFIHRSVLT